MTGSKKTETIQSGRSWIIALFLFLSFTAARASEPPFQALPKAGTNIITNGNFETDSPCGWIFSGDTEIVNNSENSGVLRLTSTPEQTSRAIFDFKDMSLAPNTQYRITARVKTNNKVYAGIGFYATKGNYIEPVDFSAFKSSLADSGWISVEIPFTTPDQYLFGKIILENYKQTPGGDIWLDDVTLIAVGGEWI